MKKISLIFIPFYLVLIACQNDDSSGGNTVIPVNVPVLNTIEAIQISPDSFKTGGVIVDDKGLAITEIGICWDTLPNPTILDWNDSKTYSSDSFELYMNNLNSETKYYYRSYARNSNGLGYGNQLVLETSEAITGDRIKMNLSGKFNLNLNDTSFQYEYDTVNFDSLHIFNKQLTQSIAGFDSVIFGLSLSSLNSAVYSQDDVNPLTSLDQFGIITYLDYDSIDNPYSLFTPISGEIDVHNFGSYVEINFFGELKDDLFILVGSNMDTISIQSGQIIMQL